MTMQPRSNVGEITEDAVESAMPVWMFQARKTREHKGVISQLVESHTLMPGKGITWVEPRMNQIEVQAVSANQWVDAPQQILPIDFVRITPSSYVSQLVIADSAKDHLQPLVWAKFSGQSETAHVRNLDIQGLRAFGEVTLAMGGPASQFSDTFVRNAVARLTSNADEPLEGAIRCVAHGFHLRAITQFYAQRGGGAGGSEISSGLTEKAVRNRFMGMLGGAETYVDNHIEIDANDDATALVFGRESMILIRDRIRRSESQRLPNWGEGGIAIYTRRKFAYGPRRPDIWAVRIFCDASAGSLTT